MLVNKRTSITCHSKVNLGTLFLTAFCTTSFLLFKSLLIIREYRCPQCQRETYITHNIEYINSLTPRLHTASKVGREIQHASTGSQCFLTSVLENAPPHPLQNHPIEKEHGLTVVSKAHKNVQKKQSFKAHTYEDNFIYFDFNLKQLINFIKALKITL